MLVVCLQAQMQTMLYGIYCKSSDVTGFITWRGGQTIAVARKTHLPPCVGDTIEREHAPVVALHLPHMQEN